MADPTRAAEEQDSSVPVNPPTQPLDIEAVWSEINTYMTTDEWACVAGTCKASWDLQLQRIVLTPDTPLSGVLRNVDSLGSRHSPMRACVP